VKVARVGFDERNESFFLDLLSSEGPAILDSRGEVTIEANNAHAYDNNRQGHKARRHHQLSGSVTPRLSGRRVTTTLLRKRYGRFMRA
jgi:hypothetical protein